MVGSPNAGWRALVPLVEKALLPRDARARIGEHDGVSPLPPLGISSLSFVHEGPEHLHKATLLVHTNKKTNAFGQTSRYCKNACWNVSRLVVPKQWKKRSTYFGNVCIHENIFLLGLSMMCRWDSFGVHTSSGSDLVLFGFLSGLSPFPIISFCDGVLM